MALTSTLTPAVVLGGGARRALPSSPAPSGRIIADPFASYLEDALDRLLPHRRIRHPERPADGAALPVEPEPESRGLPGAASSTDRVPHGTVGGEAERRLRRAGVLG